VTRRPSRPCRSRLADGQHLRVQRGEAKPERLLRAERAA
jgi:hypothetical protein